MTHPSPDDITPHDSTPPQPPSLPSLPPSFDRGPQTLDYADARVMWKGLGPGSRALLGAASVVTGLCLCAAGNRGGSYDLTVLLGIGCIIAGIFGYFAGKRPAPRAVHPAWGVQIGLAVVVCVIGAFLLPVTLSDGAYELRRGRWHPPFVQALAVIGCGVLWFTLAKLGSRWSHRRTAATAPGSVVGRDQTRGAPAPHAMSAEAHRRRSRRVWGLGLGLFAVVCAIPVIVTVSDKLRLRRMHHQCLTYFAPPEQVVFTEDGTEAQQLLSGGGDDYDRVMVFGPTFSDSEPLDAPPSRAQRYAAPLTALVGGYWSGGCTFLHARSSSDGDEQIVVVILTLKKLRSEDEHRVVEFASFTVAPSRWPNPQSAEPLPGGSTLELSLAASDRLRVLAGQPDPRDPSHFTIRCELNGQSAIIDGWLDAGRVVRLTASP